VDNTEFVLKHMVLTGLADMEVRKDVFRTPGLDKKSLADTVAIIEAGETADRAIFGPGEAGPTGNPKRDSRGLSHWDECLLRTLVCESCGKTFECCKLFRKKNGKPPILKTFTKCKPCYDTDKAPGYMEKTPETETGAMLDLEPNFGFMPSINQYGTKTHGNNSMEVGAGSMATVFAKAQQLGTSSDPTSTKVPTYPRKLVRAKVDSFRWNQKNQSTPPKVEQMATIGYGRRTHKAVRVPNMIFSNGNGWMNKNSEEHPTLTVTVSTESADYSHLSLPTPSISPKTVRVVADSGCQSSLMGLQTYYSLGLKKSDLVKCESRLSAVNRQQIEILGAIFLCLSGKDNNTG
jgi:hypothetical protein